MRSWWAWALSLALFSTSCEARQSEPSSHLSRVQFGVFYGPEIQELTEIPLEPDAPGQGMGIRLSFLTPPDPPLKVRWELERPRRPQPASKSDAGVPPPALDAGTSPRDELALDRLVQFGETTTRPGASSLDIPLAFRPGDPLGDWSVRVFVEGQSVLSRPFRVVRPKAKKPRESY